MYHQHGRFYVGSTSISASKRDFNRMATLKQTLSDSAVHVALAIRYWANKPEDFHQFSTLVLKACTTYEEAWVFEHLLISTWQAPLNFPFITEFLISAADFIRSVEHTHPRESAVRISRISSFKATRTKSPWATTTVFSISIQFCTRDKHLNST